MTDAEKARDRFVAHDAVNLGKSQCVSCIYCEPIELDCQKLNANKAEQYKFNEKVCPYKKHN